jgi:hypothetical protein
MTPGGSESLKNAERHFKGSESLNRGDVQRFLIRQMTSVIEFQRLCPPSVEPPSFGVDRHADGVRYPGESRPSA